VLGGALHLGLHLFGMVAAAGAVAAVLRRTVALGAFFGDVGREQVCHLGRDHVELQGKERRNLNGNNQVSVELFPHCPFKQEKPEIRIALMETSGFPVGRH